MKKLLAAFLIVMATAAFADLDRLNTLVQENNFWLNQGCSTTLVDPENNIFLTAAHCVNSKGDMVLMDIIREGFEDKYKFSWQLETLVVDKKIDLATLTLKRDINFTYSNPVEIYSGEEPRLGEKVYLVGNPDTSFNMMTTGTITSTNNTIESPVMNHRVFIVDSQGFGGMSGGAAYNERGQMVGVISIGMKGTSFTGIVPYTDIHNIMEKTYEKLADNNDSSVSD